MNFNEWKTLNESHQSWKKFVEDLLQHQQNVDENIKRELINEIQQIDSLLEDLQYKELT